MHRSETCSQNGQPVEMPENEKNFQQQILSAPSSVTETTPDRLLEQVQEKDWRHPSFQYMSVFAIPFFELTCFSDLQDFEVSAHVRSSRFYFWMSEGLLDWSAFCCVSL